MNWFHCPLLLVGIGAIALFVAGPQMGSFDFDNDNDGSPDVPVVAVLLSHVSDASRCAGKDQPRQKFRNSVVPAVLGIQPHSLGFEASAFVSHDGRSTLQSFCLLRC